MEQEKLLDQKCVAFARNILSFCEALKKLGNVMMAEALARSAVGVGLAVRQARLAKQNMGIRSRKNYLLSMNVAVSDAMTTAYWLELWSGDHHEQLDPDPHLREVKEIISILSIILKLKQL